MTRPHLGTLALWLVLGGCWASFPEERINQDAGATADRSVTRDQRGRDLVRDGGPRELSTQDLVAVDQEMVTDQPRHDLSVSCDPADPPWCELGVLVSCTAAGTTEFTPCPLGCEGGECCLDDDGDQVILCKNSGGDCDDSDERAFPGQTGFFVDPRGDGSYDFNCDGQDERQSTEVSDCRKDKGICVGAGWSEEAPGCGEWGDYLLCVKDGGDCATAEPESRQQACR